jgi:hypothetical protein
MRCVIIYVVGEWLAHGCSGTAPSCKIDIRVEKNMLYIIVKSPTPNLNVIQWLQMLRGLNLRKVREMTERVEITEEMKYVKRQQWLHGNYECVDNALTHDIADLGLGHDRTPKEGSPWTLSKMRIFH